jgi:hypothetical protein
MCLSASDLEAPTATPVITALATFFPISIISIIVFLAPELK